MCGVCGCSSSSPDPVESVKNNPDFSTIRQKNNPEIIPIEKKLFAGNNKIAKHNPKRADHILDCSNPTSHPTPSHT